MKLFDFRCRERKSLDEQLLCLMENHKWKKSSDRGFTAIIGNTCFWITNHPYRSFYRYPDAEDILPSKKIRRLAMARYITDTQGQ
jgi:hypothetical protein